MTKYDVTVEMVKSEEIEAENIDEALEEAEENLGEWMKGKAVSVYVNPRECETGEIERVGRL